MLLVFFQAAQAQRGRSFTSILRHLGALGLFSLAVLDSSPIPTFGGPDILIAVLAATHRNPWYEYAAVAAAGSILGAYITFAIARKAGSAYLSSKFRRGGVPAALKLFTEWGTGILAASSAIPFPFPTSMMFAAAGVSNYSTRRFLAIVGVSRAVRYSAIAIVADVYGRHFTRILRHPTQYWGWLIFFAVLVASFVAAGILINRRLSTASPA